MREPGWKNMRGFVQHNVLAKTTGSTFSSSPGPEGQNHIYIRGVTSVVNQKSGNNRALNLFVLSDVSATWCDGNDWSTSWTVCVCAWDSIPDRWWRVGLRSSRGVEWDLEVSSVTRVPGGLDAASDG